MEPEDKPYLSTAWPYILAVLVLSIVSMAVGWYFSDPNPVSRNHPSNAKGTER
jgi:hypothetical protein